MSTEENKKLIRRYQEAYNSGRLEELDQILAPNLISHNLLPGLPAGLAGAKMAHQGSLAAFPDVKTTIEDLVAEGDKITVRGTVTGTNTGSFMGAPPTGKSFKVATMSIFRVVNGKIVEHWGLIDGMSVSQQLGLMPLPA
jgi:steroid delta-isomerase-like uncharacterized protein